MLLTHCFMHHIYIAMARHAHQVTIATLNVVLNRAYEEYKEDLAEDLDDEV